LSGKGVFDTLKAGMNAVIAQVRTAIR
jgi:hypothetical protein